MLTGAVPAAVVAINGDPRLPLAASTQQQCTQRAVRGL